VRCPGLAQLSRSRVTRHVPSAFAVARRRTQDNSFLAKLTIIPAFSAIRASINLGNTPSPSESQS